MVSLSVILGGIICAFCLGLAPSVTKQPIVAVSIEETQGMCHVTYMGGLDQDRLSSLELRSPVGVIYVDDPVVGQTWDGMAPCLVTAHFNDGSGYLVGDSRT
jgi:hypothetical protein